jgi:hypothetical protein
MSAKQTIQNATSNTEEICKRLNDTKINETGVSDGDTTSNKSKKKNKKKKRKKKKRREKKKEEEGGKEGEEEGRRKEEGRKKGGGGKGREGKKREKDKSLGYPKPPRRRWCAKGTSRDPPAPSGRLWVTQTFVLLSLFSFPPFPPSSLLPSFLLPSSFFFSFLPSFFFLLLLPPFLFLPFFLLVFLFAFV